LAGRPSRYFVIPLTVVRQMSVAALAALLHCPVLTVGSRGSASSKGVARFLPLVRHVADLGVTLVISFQVGEAESEEFMQLAGSLLSSEPPPHCQARALYRKVGEPDAYLWLERWDELEEMNSHLASDGHRALVGGVRVLGELRGRWVACLSPLG